MADDLAALLEEQQRRSGQVTGGYRSVLAEPEKTTTLEEVKRAVTSVLKGSTKGIIELVGGWGKLYDVIKENKTPSALSGQGIINAIAQAGGPDLMKIQGYKGLYQAAEAGAPMALLGGISPAGSLFSGIKGALPRAAAEFGAGGTIGLLSQQAAPESPFSQLAMQTLPYMLKGGIEGLKTRSQQKLLEQYKKDLPESDVGIFNQYILKGQGSSDPLIAADITRLTRSPKYLELVTTLNEGATAAALQGMAPKGAKLTAEESKTGIIQAVQNKLAGIRESNADSLFEKAKGYGGGQGLVEPTQTLGAIEKLIGRYSAQATPNAERAVQVLQGIRDRLSPSFTTAGGGGATATGAREAIDTLTNQPIAGAPFSYQVPGATPFTVGRGPQKLTVEEVQGLLSEFGKKASAGDSLIKDLSISDERIISSAIFGSMKDDVSAALKTATGPDASALNLLNTARDRVAKSSKAYNEAIAQGLPKFLQDKSLAEIAPEDLFKTYMELTPAQRGTMRSWVQNTDQAALDVLDKQVFTNFVNQAKKPNALGVETVDLATLSKNWRELAKVPGGQDALVTALGTNASEFGQRMKDAELFTRKMSVGQNMAEPTIAPGTIRETQAAIGGVAGYSPAKISQVAMDALNSLTSKGLTEDQLMKVLLTPEGGQFLKSASLSPRSEKTLADLMAAEQSNLGAFTKWTAATTARMGPRIGSAEQPTMGAPAQPEGQQDDLQMLLEEQARRQAMQPQQ